MAKVQKWSIDCDGDIYAVEFSCRKLSKNIKVSINGETFEIPKGERKEILKLGDTQAVIDISKRGRATIYIGKNTVQELTKV